MHIGCHLSFSKGYEAMGKKALELGADCFQFFSRNPRGGAAKVDKIDVVPQGWGSVLEVFEHVYKHECHVSELIDNLVNVASEVKDKASQDFLWGYVREQVEEEATAQGIVDKLKRCNDQASILYMDDKLGARQ